MGKFLLNLGVEKVVCNYIIIPIKTVKLDQIKILKIIFHKQSQKTTNQEKIFVTYTTDKALSLICKEL